MAIIDDIEAINDKLSRWIIETSPPPGDAAANAQMKQAVALHLQLDQLLSRAQLLELQQAGKALALLETKHGALIASLTSRITATTSGIQQAESVISIAAQAIAVVVQVVALVA